MVVLGVRNEEELLNWREKISKETSFASAVFLETYPQDHYTALCSIDKDGVLERMFQELPLL